MWLEPDDAMALERLMRRYHLPSRLAALRWLIGQVQQNPNAGRLSPAKQGQSVR